MGITIAQFREFASPEQLRVLEDIIACAQREKALVDAVNDARQPYIEKAEKVRHFWGFGFSQVADLVVDQEIAPYSYAAARPQKEKLDSLRREMRCLFERGAKELGMGRFALFERQYAHYVGEPLPR